MVQGAAVVALWRHPVKSLQGEQLTAAQVTARGVVGDRSWGVRDRATGAVLSAKREPRLMLASARIAGETVTITAPDRRPATGASAAELLSDLLGREVDIDLVDATGPTFVDESPLHLVHRAALARWDVRRFRPNIVVTGDIDLDALVGHRLRLGNVVVEITKRTKRCGMVTAAQPGLPKDVDVLRVLARDCELRLGVYARVVTGGPVAVGAAVQGV